MKLQKVGIFWISETIYTSIYDITHARIQICLAQYKQMCVNLISTPRWNKSRNWVKTVWLCISPSQITKSTEMSKHFTDSSLLTAIFTWLNFLPSQTPLPPFSHQLTYP